jgi:hypothetical protein
VVPGTSDRGIPLTIFARVLALGLAAILLGGSTSTAEVAPTATTRCDCKPEFNVVAEGKGTCEVVKDNSRWCRIKFNDGTSDPKLKAGYYKAIQEAGISTRDPFLAAADLTRISPLGWSHGFAKTNFSALVAYALWDVDILTLKQTYPIVAKSAMIDPILRGVTLKPPGVLVGTFEGYEAIASWGCLQLVRGSLSILIKTPHSPAPLACAWR